MMARPVALSLLIILDAAQEGRDVEFRLNIPLSELHGVLTRAAAGLHTMRDEHFGIGVVELMAAGLVIKTRGGGIRCKGCSV